MIRFVSLVNIKVNTAIVGNGNVLEWCEGCKKMRTHVDIVSDTKFFKNRANLFLLHGINVLETTSCYQL